MPIFAISGVAVKQKDAWTGQVANTALVSHFNSADEATGNMYNSLRAKYPSTDGWQVFVNVIPLDVNWLEQLVNYEKSIDNRPHSPA